MNITRMYSSDFMSNKCLWVFEVQTWKAFIVLYNKFLSHLLHFCSPCTCMNFNHLFVPYRKYGICTLKTLNPPPTNKINHKNEFKKPSQDFVIGEKITPVKALPQNMYLKRHCTKYLVFNIINELSIQNILHFRFIPQFLYLSL